MNKPLALVIALVGCQTHVDTSIKAVADRQTFKPSYCGPNALVHSGIYVSKICLGEVEQTRFSFRAVEAIFSSREAVLYEVDDVVYEDGATLLSVYRIDGDNDDSFMLRIELKSKIPQVVSGELDIGGVFRVVLSKPYGR